jgi:hypothetical protein
MTTKATSLESFSPLDGLQISSSSFSILAEDSILFLPQQDLQQKESIPSSSLDKEIDKTNIPKSSIPLNLPGLVSIDERLLESSTIAQTTASKYLKLLDSLDARHRQISAVTSVLHAEFKRLVEAEAKSRSVVERIYRPLAFFESLFVIGRRLGLVFETQELADVASVMREVSRITSRAAQQQPQSNSGFVSPNLINSFLINSHKIRPIDLPLTTDDEEFPLALERLDECISYLSGHAQFKDATTMMMRLKNTQEHALLLVRATIQEAVERVSEEAEKELTVVSAHAAALISSGKLAPTPDAAEMTQLHMKFRTDLSHIRRLVHMVEQRSQKRACAEILNECYKTYLDRRIRLVSRVARSKLQRAADERTQSLRVILKKHDRSIIPSSTSPNKTFSPNISLSTKGLKNLSVEKTPTSSFSVHGSQRGGDGGSVYSINSSRTALTQLTSLWSEDITSRESCVVDATRTCTALMARILQAEYALFHSLFTAPLPGASLFQQPNTSVSKSLVSSTTPATVSRSRGIGQSSSSSVISGRSRSSNATSTPPSSPFNNNLHSSQIRASADAALSVMQDDLCSILFDVLRPLFIKVDSIDVLGDIVRVLRDEVLGELSAPRGPALASLQKSVMTLIADAQERIIYRAGRFLSERIDSFKRSKVVTENALLLSFPTSTGLYVILHSVKINGDLDFLGRMLSYALRVQQSSSVSDLLPPGCDSEESLAKRNFIESLPTPAIYESWHPALEMTLVLLSSLYRCVERVSFEDLAQEAVAACTRILVSESVEINTSAKQTGSSYFSKSSPIDSFFSDHVKAEIPEGISTSTPFWTRSLAAGTLRLGSLAPRVFSPPAPPIDGALFLIKNLLVLREQLSPFDISLLNTTRELDFRPTTEALQHLIEQLGSVLRFSLDNPFLAFMTEGFPKVRENTTDFKLRLESLLKSACESLIHDSFILLAGGIEAFLLKNAPLTPSSSMFPLPNGSNSAFVEDLQSILLEVQEIFKTELPALRRRLGLYLGFQVTASILFKPIKEQILGALQRLQRLSLETMQATMSSTAVNENNVLFDRLLGTLEASDQLCVDPFSSSFGSDS